MKKKLNPSKKYAFAPYLKVQRQNKINGNATIIYITANLFFCDKFLSNVLFHDLVAIKIV